MSQLRRAAAAAVAGIARLPRAVRFRARAGCLARTRPKARAGAIESVRCCPSGYYPYGFVAVERTTSPKISGGKVHRASGGAWYTFATNL